MPCHRRLSRATALIFGLTFAARAFGSTPVDAASAPALAAQVSELTVVIGTAAPLSGPLAPYGKGVTDGVRMAIDDLNQRDLRIGGRAVAWKLDAEDDQADPQLAAQIARKLVAERVNGIVGHFDSGSTKAAAPIYFAAGIPEITASASDPMLAQQGFRTFYRIIANNYAIGAGLALYAERGLKAKTAFIVDDGTTYGQSVANAFADVATGTAGIKVLERVQLSRTENSVDNLVGEIKAASPDVVFYGGLAAQAGSLLQKLRSVGSKARLLGGDGICTKDLATTAAGAADSDVICADGGLPLAKMPGGLAWKQRFDAQFGASAFDFYSPYAYDATMVLAQAMIKAGSAEPSIYRHAIRDIGYDGVTKSDVRFNSDGELIAPSITIFSYPKGRKTALSR